MAMNLEKRPSFFCNPSLWCVLIQESKSLNDFFFVGCIRGSCQKGRCLKKRAWLWSLLRKVLEVSAGKSNGGDGVEPKH